MSSTSQNGSPDKQSVASVSESETSDEVVVKFMSPSPFLAGNPHKGHSRRKLSSLRLLDSASIHVMGLPDTIRDDFPLSTNEWFGQFGELLSVRLLQCKNLGEAFIRFKNPSDAKRALEWCNGESTPGLAAKHGYQKYCSKFLEGVQCERKDCQHRHTWADPKDVMERPVSAIGAANDQKLKPEERVRRNKELYSKMLNSKHNLSIRDQMEVLQNQFLCLQGQFRSQNALIDQLRGTLSLLRQQNEELTKENVYLRQTDRMVAQAVPLPSMNGGYHILYSPNGQTPDDNPTPPVMNPMNPTPNPPHSLPRFNPTPGAYDPSLMSMQPPSLYNAFAPMNDTGINVLNSLSWMTPTPCPPPSIPSGNAMSPIATGNGRGTPTRLIGNVGSHSMSMQLNAKQLQNPTSSTSSTANQSE